MDFQQYLIIYLPIFLLLFVIIPNSENTLHKIIRINKKKKLSGGELKMTNELIKSYLGKNCIISSSGWSSVQGEIISIVDNWLEVKTKKNNQLLNVDYITSITEITK